MARSHRVPLAALEPEGRALVEVDGRQIALFRVGSAVHAFENACPHAGNPLVEADILGPTLTCVYHGWRFDLETGACLAGEEPAHRYPAEVHGDWISIELSART